MYLPSGASAYPPAPRFVASPTYCQIFVLIVADILLSEIVVKCTRVSTIMEMTAMAVIDERLGLIFLSADIDLEQDVTKAVVSYDREC